MAASLDLRFELFPPNGPEPVGTAPQRIGIPAAKRTYRRVPDSVSW